MLVQYLLPVKYKNITDPQSHIYGMEGGVKTKKVIKIEKNWEILGKY